MCFRPTAAKKREIACPKCAKMNPLPISIESTIGDILKDESAKPILEKHCAAMVADPRFKQATGMTLKQVIPMSQGKITQAIVGLVGQELAALPHENKCQFCGEALPEAPGPAKGPGGPAGPR